MSYHLRKPTDRQVGGEHYKTIGIQPVLYIFSNKLGFLEGTAIKYVTRHKTKGRAEDIKKAIHCLEMLLELEYGETFDDSTSKD